MYSPNCNLLSFEVQSDLHPSQNSSKVTSSYRSLTNMSCMITTDFYHDCAHIVTTRVCNEPDSSIIESRGSDGPCAETCVHTVLLPVYHIDQSCPWCHTFPYTPVVPNSAKRSENVTLNPSSRETRRVRFRRHARAIRSARQAVYDRERKARLRQLIFNERMKAWEEQIWTEREFEAYKNVPLERRTFYMEHDDNELFQPVQQAALLQEDHYCTICTEKHGSETVSLPCRHIFHRQCIYTWLFTTKKPTCPICRQRYKIEKMPDFTVDGE
jgi:hypothetical protein